MATIRTDGLALRCNGYYLFTYPKKGDIFQFWAIDHRSPRFKKLEDLGTLVEIQFLLMPKSIFTSWEQE